MTDELTRRRLLATGTGALAAGAWGLSPGAAQAGKFDIVLPS